MPGIKEIYEKYWESRQSESNKRSLKEYNYSDLSETIGDVLNIIGKRHLDVGCGNGNLIEIVNNKTSKIYGCDISKTALTLSKIKDFATTCVDLNLGYLPYKDKSFDSITCIEVVEHVLDPLFLLRELNRILAINGELVVTTPNIRYFRHLGKLLFKGSFPHTTTDSHVWGGGHFHYFTRNDLSYLFRSAGFKKIKFVVNHKQFTRSYKRKVTNKIFGEHIFGEWFCNGIITKAFKV